MGYRISYENGWNKSTFINPKKKKKKRLYLWVAFVLTAISVSVALNNDSIRQTLLPGDGATTETAIKNFVESVQSGNGIGASVTAFCREVIENAR